MPREEACPNPRCVDGWTDPPLVDVDVVIWAAGDEAPVRAPGPRGGPLAPLVAAERERRRAAADQLVESGPLDGADRSAPW